MKLLLRHPDIDVNSRNSPGGATALMGAARRGHSRIVELLLRAPGCEAGLRDRDGNTALAQARTESVRWRLTQGRSRSEENILPGGRPNPCHTPASPPPYPDPARSHSDSSSPPPSPARPGLPEQLSRSCHILELFHEDAVLAQSPDFAILTPDPDRG